MTPLDSSPCAIVSADIDGTITDVNATLLEWTGHERGQLVGTRDVGDLLTRGGGIYHATIVMPLLHMQGEVREIAVDLQRADGEPLPVLMSITLERGADGQAAGMHVAISPARERALYESELRRRYDSARAARDRNQALLRVAGELAGAFDAQRVADGVAGEAARALAAHVIARLRSDIVASAGTAPEPARPAVHLVTPIRSAGETVGTVHVVPTHGDPAAADFLSECAAQAARALERIERFETMTRLAGVDELTGLPNRRTWSTEMEREFARARRDGTCVALAVLDLDHFKSFNDTYGRDAGDLLLKRVAGEWTSRLRATDLIARIGGEEFAVLAPSCDSDTAAILVERLRVAVPEPVTCSAGVAVWDGSESAEVLLERAGRALHEAKYGGRDRLAVAPHLPPAQGSGTGAGRG